MPLAAQALLPFVVLLGAAAIVWRRPRNPANGWIASGATAIAAIIALIELVRLAPGEHVDVPYLTTFPYADLAIRLDGLSLAFAAMALVTAALLMLSRQQLRGDRREPWFGWLLTSAAACAVILADNLLLVYVALQLLTLAWSGALDETAPRRRGLRLAVQIADIGLLLAAASAIQSVGTSAFSGVPSDTFGLATFLLVLLPVVVRVGALAWVSGGPPSSVAFEPAIAWVAPAGYVLLRLLALMGGRLPDRPTAVLVFAGGSLAAAGFCGVALWLTSGPRRIALLMAAQAALALAFSTGNVPLMTVACTWLWLVLVPLAGLASVQLADGSAAAGLTLLDLSMLPGTIAFVGVWLGGLALNAQGLLVGMIPVALALVGAATVSFGRAVVPRAIRLDVVTGWATALLLLAGLPVILLTPLVLPAAATVRSIPGGTVLAGALGITTGAGSWPALSVTLVAATVLGLAGWQLRRRLPLLRASGRARRRLRTPWTARPRLPPLPAWSRLMFWGAFLVVVGIVVTRP